MRMDQFYQQCNCPSAQCFVSLKMKDKRCCVNQLFSCLQKKISSLQLLVQNEITCDYVATILKINREVEDAQGWILIEYWTAVG